MQKTTTLTAQNSNSEISTTDSVFIPTLFTREGEQASYRFAEFFTAQIRNPNTRAAYFRAVERFTAWCEGRGVTLPHIQSIHVAAYIEGLGHELAAPTVKQHLAAIRMLFDWLVTGQVVPANPATSVRGPKHVVKKGKTPVLSGDEMRDLLDSIDTTKIAGLRDKALIGVMAYSFARVGAVVAMNVEDYFQQGRRMWFRLHEKGGKYHAVPAHHEAEELVDAYLDAAGIWDDKKGPLFRSLDAKKQLTTKRLHRRWVGAMVKRRAKKAGLPDTISCHSFRAAGITNYLQNGGSLEYAQQIAAHESPKTTKLYDLTSDEISLDEVERIRF